MRSWEILAACGSLLLFGLFVSLPAQTVVEVTITGAAVEMQGGAVTASLNLSAPAVAVQFEVSRGTTITLSPEAVAAGKTLTCADTIDSRRCLIVGMNRNLIAGPAATLVFPGVSELGPFLLSVSEVMVADDTPTADGSTANVSGLSVIITTPCDLDLSGATDLNDVLLAVAQALAEAGGCISADLDGDGACTVIDVQQLVNVSRDELVCPL